jgi:hypothetical protein
MELKKNISELETGEVVVNIRAILNDIEIGKFLFVEIPNEGKTHQEFISEVEAQGVNHSLFIPNENYNG